MLDKTIEKHIDEMDEIEIQASNDIDKIFEGLDIDALIDNPKEELENFVLIMTEILKDSYLDIAVAEGVKLANKIEEFRKKDKDIIVEDSNNPKLNEGQFDDQRRD